MDSTNLDDLHLSTWTLVSAQCCTSLIRHRVSGRNRGSLPPPPKTHTKWHAEDHKENLSVEITVFISRTEWLAKSTASTYTKPYKLTSICLSFAMWKIMNTSPGNFNTSWVFSSFTRSWLFCLTAMRVVLLLLVFTPSIILGRTTFSWFVWFRFDVFPSAGA